MNRRTNKHDFRKREREREIKKIICNLRERGKERNYQCKRHYYNKKKQKTHKKELGL